LPLLNLLELINEPQQKKDQENKITFSTMAAEIINRQKYDKDNILLVSGPRGAGKSSFVIKLQKQFIRLKEEEDKNYEWSWDKNYMLTKSQTINTLENKTLGTGSFFVIDEAADIAYRGDTMEREAKILKKIFYKTREQQHLSLINIPDIFKLDKEITNMAIMAVIIAYRFKNVCSFAFIYGRNPNVLTDDQFGFDKIKRLMKSDKAPRKFLNPTLSGRMRVMYAGNDRNTIVPPEDVIDDKYIKIPYPKELFQLYMSLPSFLGILRFGKADERMYEQYLKNVKAKNMAKKYKDEFVKKSDYDQLLRAYSTLLYNLYTKTEINKYARIERLLIDPETKSRLATAITIKRHIDKISLEVS